MSYSIPPITLLLPCATAVSSSASTSSACSLNGRNPPAVCVFRIRIPPSTFFLRIAMRINESKLCVPVTSQFSFLHQISQARSISSRNSSDSTVDLSRNPAPYTFLLNAPTMAFITSEFRSRSRALARNTSLSPASAQAAGMFSAYQFVFECTLLKLAPS